jgi:hypothetical protein
MWTILEDRLHARLRSDPAIRAKVKQTETAVANGEMTPTVAAETVAGCWNSDERKAAHPHHRLPALSGRTYNPTEKLVERLLRFVAPRSIPSNGSDIFFPSPMAQ